MPLPLPIPAPSNPPAPLPPPLLALLLLLPAGRRRALTTPRLHPLPCWRCRRWSCGGRRPWCRRRGWCCCRCLWAKLLSCFLLVLFLVGRPRCRLWRFCRCCGGGGRCGGRPFPPLPRLLGSALPPSFLCFLPAASLSSRLRYHRHCRRGRDWGWGWGRAAARGGLSAPRLLRCVRSCAPLGPAVGECVYGSGVAVGERVARCCSEWPAASTREGAAPAGAGGQCGAWMWVQHGCGCRPWKTWV